MRRIVLITIASLLATAAPPAAQATSAATPNKAGKASRLHFALDGLAPPTNGRIPLGIELNAPSGFRLNLKAVARRCSQQSAKLNECPRTSRFGKGVLRVHVTTPNESRDVTIPMNIYLHSRKKILAVAYVLGWQVVPGTIARDGGFALTFNPLPAGPPFPGVSYTLESITFDLGTKRVIRQRVRRNGRTIVRKRTVSLITNPRTCSGSWATAIGLTFRDATTARLVAPTTCLAR
jgi:hypothetical protein